MKGKKLLSVLLALVMAAGLCVPAMAASEEQSFRVIAPADWELGVGDSRTLDYVFTSADKADRMLTWTSDHEEIAKVDEWGRVTGVAPGTAEITATQVVTVGDTPLTDSVTVTVVAAATAGAPHAGVVNYAGGAVAEVKNLQKVVTRWSTADAKADSAVPDAVKTAMDASDKSAYSTATTADGAVWSITDYGVKRVGGVAATERDETMRFMGDRYFYESDTTTGKVLGIAADGGYGIWTIMATGVTHIAMVELSAADKAEEMSETTQNCVSRRGMVSQARTSDGGATWIPQESDNDGLWTAMYGAGELMRYASLRRALASNPLNADLQRQTAQAKQNAALATEAVLLLANISMRGGDVEAYVKHFEDRGYTPNAAGSWPLYSDTDKDLSGKSLVKDGNYSVYVPAGSPASYSFGSAGRLIRPLDANAWATGEHTYATRSRSLGGFIARTYSVVGEPGQSAPGGSVYYSFADYNAISNAKSQGLSSNQDINGLSMNISADASGSIPDRLYNDIFTANGISLSDVYYKGDTSADEIIGHLFLYKIAYDVFKDSDPELAGIISDTADGFAQHLSDNEYMLLDATGQPTTWGKMNREYFYTYRWGASSSPLTASVLLCAFKVAAYVTGYQKWENEYELLLSDGAYLYDDVTATHTMRDEEFLNNYAGAMLYGTLSTLPLTTYLDGTNQMQKPLAAEKSFLLREFAQYSDEEMAMLAFYLLFQTETDTETLAVYKDALDQWWKESIQYSENPLWYYIYQLSDPTNTKIKDAYGNNILETAAWSLSRHPIDTRKWLASNVNRDDIINIDLQNYGLDTRGGLTFDKQAYLMGTAQFPEPDGKQETTTNVIGALLQGYITQGTITLTPVVAAPDERAMHKYNGPSYVLTGDHDSNQMEGSTTYTLPYWMGVYHGMLALSDFAYVPLPEPVPEKKPTPANELFRDVPADAWYHGAVTWAADKGLFEGADGLFDPDGVMTRAMLVQVLWRMEKAPVAEGCVSGFSDVPAGAWYHDAVCWAAGQKLVMGYDGRFAPDDPVTREQTAAILLRYAKLRGIDVSLPQGQVLSGFLDADAISDWAADAMAWAVQRGILRGDGGLLSPGAHSTRAQVAAMLQRFLAGAEK